MDKFRQKVNSMLGTDAVSTRSPLPLGHEVEAFERAGRFRLATGI